MKRGMLLRCRRQVHRRVPVEEAVRAQHESDLVYRHGGPILRAGDIRVPERIPHDQIGVGDGPVCCGPHRQSVAACALVGIVSRGITLITPIRRHPQVLFEKSRPLDHGRVVYRSAVQADATWQRSVVISCQGKWMRKVGKSSTTRGLARIVHLHCSVEFHSASVAGDFTLTLQQRLGFARFLQAL